MGGLKKVPPEGGSGGGRGHSGMEHWATTAEVKDAARLARRSTDRKAIREGLSDSTTSPQPHRRHAIVYFHRSGSPAIVVAQHYNGAGGALIEDANAVVLDKSEDDAALTESLRDALANSTVLPEINLRSRKRADWPAYIASGARSVRAFESEFIPVSVSGANDSNVTYELEGLPEAHSELRVASSVAAGSDELGLRCLAVWRACRDRNV